MKNQTEPHQTTAWEAPVWLRDAIALNDLPPQGDDANDDVSADETLSPEDHPLGFV